MVSLLTDLRAEKRGAKEQVTYLAARLSADPALLAELPEALAFAKTPEQGALVEALTVVTEATPRAAAGLIPTVIVCLDSKSPRVRWEAARTLANAAATFPKACSEAVPALLANTTHDGTVVRWSAAVALVAVYKVNPSLQAELQIEIHGVLQRETNSGVRNVYLKGLEDLLPQAKG